MLYIEFTISPIISKQICVGICVALPIVISGIEDGMWSMVETYRTQVVLLTQSCRNTERSDYTFRRYSTVAAFLWVFSPYNEVCMYTEWLTEGVGHAHPIDDLVYRNDNWLDNA